MISCFIHLCNSHSPLILRKSLLYIFCIALICTVAERMCNTFYAIVLSYQNNLLTSTSQGWNIVFSHKFASSVNLDKFTLFARFRLSPSCAKMLVGVLPNPLISPHCRWWLRIHSERYFSFPRKENGSNITITALSFSICVCSLSLYFN